MKAFKALIKPFEAPQRSVRIKIYVNFFFLSGIGTLRVKVWGIETHAFQIDFLTNMIACKH